MGWLFRDGDTKNAKLFTLASFVLTGISIIGLLDQRNMVPHASLKPWAVAAGFFVAACTLVALFKDEHPENRFARYGLLKQLGALVLVLPMSWSIGFFAAWLGMPSIWADVALTPTVATTSVTHVLREHSGRGCPHRIRIEGGPLPEAMTPCVSKALRESLCSGSEVDIKYTDSGGAFVVQDIAFSK